MCVFLSQKPYTADPGENADWRPSVRGRQAEKPTSNQSTTDSDATPPGSREMAKFETQHADMELRATAPKRRYHPDILRPFPTCQPVLDSTIRVQTPTGNLEHQGQTQLVNEMCVLELQADHRRCRMWFHETFHVSTMREITPTVIDQLRHDEHECMCTIQSVMCARKLITVVPRGM